MEMSCGDDADFSCAWSALDVTLWEWTVVVVDVTMSVVILETQ